MFRPRRLPHPHQFVARAEDRDAGAVEDAHDRRPHARRHRDLRGAQDDAGGKDHLPAPRVAAARRDVPAGDGGLAHADRLPDPPKPPPSDAVSSTGTTASAPGGTAAPVMTATASPAPTARVAARPAATSPATRSTTGPGTSAARTAYPSIRLLSNGG